MCIHAFELLGGSRGLNDTIRALSLFFLNVTAFFSVNIGLPAQFKTATPPIPPPSSFPEESDL